MLWYQSYVYDTESHTNQLPLCSAVALVSSIRTLFLVCCRCCCGCFLESRFIAISKCVERLFSSLFYWNCCHCYQVWLCAIARQSKVKVKSIFFVGLFTIACSTHLQTNTFFNRLLVTIKATTKKTNKQAATQEENWNMFFLYRLMWICTKKKHFLLFVVVAAGWYTYSCRSLFISPPSSAKYVILTIA